MSQAPTHVLVTGGAGYIGAVLVPELLALGHRVTVFDLLIFGDAPLAAVADDPALRVIRGDVRDDSALTGLFEAGPYDAVIHLAAISNDPSSDLDPAVTQAVNGTAVTRCMQLAKQHGVRRFLYASSASVYGIKDTPDVTEALSLEPITLYAKLKAEGETVLGGLVDDGFVGVSVRSATVCGDSPRLRLDLTINLLTDQALRVGKLRVFGGGQMRPNVHVTDLARFYIQLLDADPAVVNGQAFNVSRVNSTVMQLAEMIREVVDPALEIEVTPSNDPRSYHLSAERAKRELGFEAAVELPEAVRELQRAYREGRIRDGGQDVYRNVAWMKAHPDTWQA